MVSLSFLMPQAVSYGRIPLYPRLNQKSCQKGPWCKATANQLIPSGRSSAFDANKHNTHQISDDSSTGIFNHRAVEYLTAEVTAK